MTDIYKYTILEYFGDGAQKCGYCRGIDSSYTYGMWAHTLHCLDYQNLINRGWRRSGAYLYKPKMEITCCPLYTIRCDALNFRISKSQKKTIKKVVKFILSDIKTNVNDLVDKDTCLAETKKEMKQKDVKPGQGIDPNKPPCRKAKLIRQELKKQKVHSKIEPSTSKTNEDSSISSQFFSNEKEFRHKQRPTALKLTNTRKEEKANDDNNDYFSSEILKTDVGWLNIPEKGVHKLKVKLIHSNMKSQEFHSSVNESYEVYKKYQQIIHNDPLDAITFPQYLRFLVKSPLEDSRISYNSGDQFGTFHMQYILDDRIIAVGVLDILPQCVSSVYFYYDPDFSFLSLGTYAALQEIKLVQQLKQMIPSMKFYYMGYYIHSCPKMLYKAAYIPSYLLCPFTNTWVSFEISRPKIDASKCARLNDEDVFDENAEFDINEINILSDQILYKMNEYIDSHGNSELTQIMEWAKFIGKSTVMNSILIR